MARGKPGGNPQNLLAGGVPGNRGGGRTSAKVRETKQAFLDAIFDSVQGEGEDRKVVGDLIKRRVIADALDPSLKAAPARQWLYEMQHGKPQAKVEMVIGKPEILNALVHALHEASVDPDQARLVIEGMRDFISANVE